jgi:hypothetical protein
MMGYIQQLADLRMDLLLRRIAIAITISNFNFGSILRRYYLTADVEINPLIYTSMAHDKFKSRTSVLLFATRQV